MLPLRDVENIGFHDAGWAVVLPDGTLLETPAAPRSVFALKTDAALAAMAIPGATVERVLGMDMPGILQTPADDLTK